MNERRKDGKRKKGKEEREEKEDEKLHKVKTKMIAYKLMLSPSVPSRHIGEYRYTSTHS